MGCDKVSRFKDDEDDDNDDSRPNLEYVSNTLIKTSSKSAKLELERGKVAIATLETLVDDSTTLFNDNKSKYKKIHKKFYSKYMKYYIHNYFFIIKLEH